MKRRWVVVRHHNNPDAEIKCYEYREGKIVLAMLEKYSPPNNSHFSIWELTIYLKPEKKTPAWSSNFPTKRDAKRYAEENIK